MNDTANANRCDLNDELETGEPLTEPSTDGESEAQPVKKKIRARSVPFNGHASCRSDRVRDDLPGSESQPAGQMVLTTAKYMPREALEPEPRRQGQAHKNKGQPSEQASGLGGKVFSSGKWGGVIAMAVAFVWFVAGMMNDTVIFYPLFLFVIGLAAFMKDVLKGD